MNNKRFVLQAKQILSCKFHCDCQHMCKLSVQYFDIPYGVHWIYVQFCLIQSIRITLHWRFFIIFAHLHAKQMKKYDRNNWNNLKEIASHASLIHICACVCFIRHVSLSMRLRYYTFRCCTLVALSVTSHVYTHIFFSFEYKDKNKHSQLIWVIKKHCYSIT